jgi:hypothetical protein
MGRMLEDMTRLNEEIQALRGSRRAFLMELSVDNRDRQRDVLDMVAHFAGKQTQTATRLKDGRIEFMHDLRRTVRGQLRKVRADIAGARRAWSGEAA